MKHVADCGIKANILTTSEQRIDDSLQERVNVRRGLLYSYENSCRFRGWTPAEVAGVKLKGTHRWMIFINGCKIRVMLENSTSTESCHS